MDSLTVLAAALPDTLVHLKLERCSLKRAAPLVSRLGALRLLERLDLTANKLGWECLVGVLEHLTTGSGRLAQLQLRDNPIFAVASQADVLQYAARLRRLDVAGELFSKRSLTFAYRGRTLEPATPLSVGLGGTGFRYEDRAFADFFSTLFHVL